MRPGGAVLVFDKTEQVPGYLGTVIYRLALANKMSLGVPAQEILEKEMSLSGIQRPLANREIPKNFVEVFRMGDFAGWVAEADNFSPVTALIAGG